MGVEKQPREGAWVMILRFISRPKKVVEAKDESGKMAKAVSRLLQQENGTSMNAFSANNPVSQAQDKV